MPYTVVVNTDAYRQRRCSKENWEPGTTNSFMKAVNGWRTEEPDIESVKWRIEMFLHGTPLDAFDDPKCNEWYNDPKNQIKYHDMPCDIMRNAFIECPGWHQGYCRIGKLLEELETSGHVRIPFAYAYDMRQYIKNMDGCFMEISKK